VETRHRFYAAPARSAAGLPDSPSEPFVREDVRVPVFMAAGIVFIEGQSEAWACTVRDLSHGGARLELDRSRPPHVSEQLPDIIILYICPDRTEVQCRIAWRDGRHFGVAFLSDVSASTRRPA
jgi:hypothetical protein